MAIYRVSYEHEIYGSQGHSHHTNKLAARKAAREYLEITDDGYNVRVALRRFSIESMPTPKTKADVVRLLDIWGSHPDNG